jgi:lipocalin
LLALPLRKSHSYALLITHNRTFSHLSKEKRWQKYHYHVLKMSINRASMIVGLPSQKMLWLSGDIHP